MKTTKTITRADYMSGRATHDEYYDALCDLAGVSYADADPQFIERCREALFSGDEHLNSIPLKEWDRRASSLLPGVGRAFKEVGDHPSAAGLVCLLKAAARRAALDDVPVLTRFGRPLRHWDNGSGRWWLYCESLGPFGVVRADTYEEAAETVQDEIMSGVTYAEMLEELGLDPDYDFTNEGLPDGYGFRSNGEPVSAWSHGEIYCEDLNGCTLVVLTPDVVREFEFEVRVQLDDNGYEIEEEQA